MPTKAPAVVVLAGPKGAGKSTAAPRLLRRTLRVTEFLNADLIARDTPLHEFVHSGQHDFASLNRRPLRCERRESLTRRSTRAK